MSNEDPRVYDALALPPEALSNGGVEILRIGIIDNELYVQARRAFKDPARWGEVLADIARALALYNPAKDRSLSEAESFIQTGKAFAADLGAPVIDERAPPAKAKAAASSKPVAKAKSTTASK